MSLSINNNITALNAWRNLKQTDGKISSAMEKLSSGLRINRAADDPAGLVISEKMRAQLSGISAATKNVEKAVNMISTAEAALDKANSLLLKMRELALDSANLGVNDDAMLKANQDELDEAIDSIMRIAKFTQFGTNKLLDGSLDGSYSSYRTAGTISVGVSVVFQVGANENQSVKVDIQSVQAQDIAKLSAGSTGVEYNLQNGTTATNGTVFGMISTSGRTAAEVSNLSGSGSFGTFDSTRVSLRMLRSAPTSSTSTYLLDSSNNVVATSFKRGVFAMTTGTTLNGATVDKADAIAQAIAIIDMAVEDVSTVRGKLGAIQADNLEPTLDSLRVAYENLQASESTIRDADMTQEMATFTKYQIMMQAGTAMLAQANQMPQSILKLLQ